MGRKWIALKMVVNADMRQYERDVEFNLNKNANSQKMFYFYLRI